MKRQAALLLIVLLGCSHVNICSSELTPQVNSVVTPTSNHTTTTEKPTSKVPVLVDLLLKEIATLNRDAANEKMQEEIGKTLKAEAEKSTVTPTTGGKVMVKVVLNKTGDVIDVNRLLEEDFTIKNDNPDDDDEDDEDDEDDDDIYDDDDLDIDDDSDDEEDWDRTIASCPKFCKCIKGFETITAKCDSLDDTQIFGAGINHLEVTGNVLEPKKLRLGHHALHAFGLQQLESVQFIDVEFTEFDKTVFYGLPDLYTVTITRTNLQTLDPDLFQNNSQLNILSISGHNFKFNQKGKQKEYLLNAPSLNELVFSNNSLTKLPRLAFAKMPELMYINLRDNQLRTLDRATFATLESLGELDVSNNQLSYFNANFFDGLELRTLRINNNNFLSLRCIRSEDLTVLDASGNHFEHILKDDLLLLPKIDQLFLKSNGITKIDKRAFDSLDQMTYLDISDNAITSITETHFKSNPRLQILLMNDNPNLQSLPVFKTNTEEHGTFSIYRFECSNCGLTYLEEKTFNAMPALTTLNLSKNLLSYIPKGLFSKLQSLRDLNLSENLISELQPNMFLGAVSLTKLNLAGNLLKSLQVTPFLMTPSLFRLDVSRNHLERVWSEAREPLQSLRFLSVRGNWLKRYTVEELKATPKLSGLNMNQNPMLCDRDFKDAIEFLTKNGIVPKQSLISSEDYSNSYESITEWSDLAKKVCKFFIEGPPSRTPDKFPVNMYNVHIKTSSDLASNINKNEINDQDLKDDIDDEDIEDEDDNDSDNQLVYDQEIGDGIISFTSSNQEEYEEDEEVLRKRYEYRTWYNGIVSPIMITIFVTLLVFWLIAVFVYVSKRRRNGPVIRPPMILRQGFSDNKNCGLVYKPLQEEIATPHMPKRGSFYSSSTFHYDKIVPESV